MKPYYSEGGIEIFHGDCREVLPTIDLADLVLTDPPYNVGIYYGVSTSDERPDYWTWCREWFKTCRRSPCVALTPGIANLGGWYAIEEPDWILAWHKPAAMGRAYLGFNNWEPVLYWGPRLASGVDVVRAPIVPDASLDGHPCPKPLKWATTLISLLSQDGDTVIDPFMGSGTTLRAAKDLGRKAIGIEIEERYCEIAARRLGQEVMDFGRAETST